MRVLYISYENVFRTGILQAQVLVPLKILAKKYGVDSLVFSTCKNSEVDDIYLRNKERFDADQPQGEAKVEVREFGKKLTRRQTILRFFLDVMPIIIAAGNAARECDIIHSRSYGAAFIAMLASRISGVPYIFDMRGLLPEEISEVNGLSETSLKFRLMKLAEGYLVKKATYVFTVSNRFNDYVLQRYPGTKVLNIQNPTVFNELSSGLPDGPLGIIYSGSLRVWHMPVETLNYYKRLHQRFGDKIRLIFCTNDIVEAKELMLDVGLPECSYELHSVPFFEMPKYYRRARVAFCFIRPSLAKSVCFPVKFSEYIESNLFVFVNEGIGDLGDIVREAKCGSVYGDVQNIDKNIEDMAAKIEELLAADGWPYDREDLRYLEWESGASKIYDAYEECLRLSS